MEQHPSHFFKRFGTVPRLGEALRAHYPAWRIELIRNFSFEAASNIYVREILHKNQDEVLVYARVEIPHETYQAFQEEFSTLGERSIGDHFLFLRQDVSRTPFEFITVTAQHPVYSTVKTYLPQKTEYQGRFSTFNINNFPLFMLEIFR